MNTSLTPRGFALAEWTDLYGKPCSVQESSIMDPPALWLGVHAQRMHLTQEMARDLVPLLQAFAATGKLPAAHQQPKGA